MNKKLLYFNLFIVITLNGMNNNQKTPIEKLKENLIALKTKIPPQVPSNQQNEDLSDSSEPFCGFKKGFLNNQENEN